jgi:uncharacterized protein YjbI with pentapeptide repeats
MKQGWKYLLYASIIIAGGFILFQTIRLKNTGFEGKTLWDWMELLIIPLVLAGGAFFLNRSERETEREIATDRQQEAALQSYFDRMAELLLKEKLRTTKKAEVRDVARTRTLSIMRVLDTNRNNLVLQFLREAKLITDNNSILNGAWMDGMNLKKLNLVGVSLQEVLLSDANLHGANLAGANLQNAVLGDTNLQSAILGGANLEDAYLQESNLQGAYLKGAYLKDAYLILANLARADLRGADLRSANLRDVDLKDADLRGAKLSNADLERAKLKGANLEHAVLKNVKVTEEQLAKAKSLKGATMPDGTIHE